MPMTSTLAADPALKNAFLKGGGDMGSRIRHIDWSAHALGDSGEWSPALKALVGLMLNANQPMYIAWGRDGFLLYNDAYATLMGDKHPNALGQPLLVAWQEIAEPLKKIVDEVWSGNPVHMEDIEFTVQRHGKPEEAHFSFSLTPVRTPTGDIEGLFCACAETSKQVFADRRVAEETRRQRALFARAPGFITILRGPEHIYEFVNDSYLSLFGKRDFIGQPIRQVFPELVGQGFYEWLDQVYSSGQRFVARDVPILLQLTPNGPKEQRFLDFIYEPVLDESGTTTGIFCEGYDTTEAHLAHTALVILNADLERQVAERAHERGLIWNVTFDLLGVLNKEAVFETSNPAWFTVLGWSAQEVQTTPLFELLHPDDVSATEQGFAKLLRGDALVNFVNRYRHKAGHYRWISWTAVPEKEKLYCSGRDVTAEKEAELALESTRVALRQAQKMEAIGQLTGGIAHDFNNLLGGIGASLEMLQSRLETGKTEGAERYIGLGQQSVRRAAALTQRLLAFSRRQTLDPRPVDVNRLVGGMEELVRRTVGPTVELEVVGAGGLWPTRIDASQLENSLLNLCINARDAMQPAGGRLTIETANKWLDERAAAEREVPPGQYISLCVSDTGTGMTPDVISRAFDPFFTTKPIGQGTGLGLSMVYGFVRQSGGQLRIYSELGQGTTMCMYLPRHVGEAEHADEVSGREVIEPGDGETILVIEDDDVIRQVLAEVLEDAGYRVIAAEDGPAGLRLLQAQGRIDLLVTDVGLPGGLNGRQVADAARVSRADLKVLFITGYAENAVVGNGHLERGMEVVTKPFEIAALVNKVRSMVELP